MSHLPKDYVGVSTRIDQFHAKFPNGSIETNFTMQNGIVSFVARVTTDVDKPRIFNGSSFGELAKEKSFEKLETVAVGRALAFLGFETQSGIASQEEMEKLNSPQTQNQSQSNAQSTTASNTDVTGGHRFGDADFEALKNKLKDGTIKHADHAVERSKDRCKKMVSKKRQETIRAFVENTAPEENEDLPF